MRTNNNLRISGRNIAVLSGLLMVVSMIILAAFATTVGLDRSADAGMSMRAVGKGFDQYSGNIEGMEKRGRVFLKHVDDMSSRRLDYFAEWKKQGDSYANSEITWLISEQRHAGLTEIFARIPPANVGTRGAFSNYLPNIKEIEQYLSEIDRYFTKDLRVSQYADGSKDH